MSANHTTGRLYRHPDLYFDDGTLVIQVENIIFKIHRSMLVQYSTVIRDMLDPPTDETSIDGSDECPLLLPGDSSEGWELLLGLQYRVPLAEPERLRGKQLLKILMIAHKYCMERIESGIIAKLRTTWDYDGFVDMIVASQIIDSDDLYEDGLRQLIASKTLPTLAQAERMGVKAAHAVMRAVYTSLKTETETRMRILLDQHAQQLAAALDRDCECSQQSAQWSYYNGQYQGMAEAELSPESNGHGQPQRHRDLYLEDGTLVIQVEDILFKVHRSVLARYSTIIRDMFNLPIDSWSNDGTDAHPLVLSGDSAVAWELLLGLQYIVPLIEYKQLKGDQLLQILKIAHKYCMERIEADVIEELKSTSDCDGFVDIIVASQIIDSKYLYQEGLQRMITFGSAPSLSQAMRIGTEATHAIMQALLTIMQTGTHEYHQEIAEWSDESHCLPIDQSRCSIAQSLSNDQSNGQSHRHHDLYFEDGALVIQNMLIPISSPSMRRKELKGEQLLKILPIAHKYRMEKIESYIVEELKNAIDYDGFVDLIVASRIVDSTQLYQDGLQRLISSGSSPTLEQANLIGAEATHMVMNAVIDTLTKANMALKEANQAEVATVRAGMNQRIAVINTQNAVTIAAMKLQAETDAKANNTKCRHCSQVTNWSCQNLSCFKYQL
ncbi:hypothetical protein FRC17_002910 [Serendipita sp. 399]|nr:hypothetical protein FRC17_002910 [Serendipita sp. 399]